MPGRSVRSPRPPPRVLAANIGCAEVEVGRLTALDSIGVPVCPDEGAVAFDRDTAGTMLVVVAIVPAVKSAGAEAKRIFRYRQVLLRGAPPLGIARGVLRFYGRECRCHTLLTFLRGNYSRIRIPANCGLDGVRARVDPPNASVPLISTVGGRWPGTRPSG